jgi:outer membrane protein assembly factor BamD
MALFRLSAVCASIALGALLAGCGTTPKDATADWSPNRLYQEAMDEKNAGNLAQAITYFDKLENRAAGTPLAQQAQLEKAHAHYRAGETAQAEAALERFMRLHPASPALDYALYLKGLVNFNDNLGILGWLSRQDLSERDQKAAKLSFEAFKELVNRFPNSRYASDAQQRMTYIVNSLAQSEVNVARYYFQRKAYVASVARAQQAITLYPTAPAQEEALGILVHAYDALGMTDLRDDSRRVLMSNYPQTRYARAEALLAGDKPWWRVW